MINGLADQINTFRVNNGRPALTISTLGTKDAEVRANQVGIYLRTNGPGTPGYNPHQGYDTTAANLGYSLVSENLAWITTDPVYIVGAVWQDSLHLAAMLSTNANVMGVSCLYDSGTAYWTYEPGICSGASCGAPSPPPSGPPPSGPPTLDGEDWAFLTLINNFRAQNGAGPLQMSVELATAAAWMSNDMATKNYFSHTDSLGRSSGARLAAFGYTYSPWGENLAAGFADAQSAFDGLRNACDPDGSGNCTYAHRQNMLGAGFTAIGIARATAPGATYGWYWTTDFGGFVEQAILPPGPGNPSVPSIASFTANPSGIVAGQSTNLLWTVTGAAGLSLDHGIGAVSGIGVTVTPGQTTTYTLTASNSAGSVTATVTVTVSPAKDTQPPTAPALTSAVARSSLEVDLAWTASTDNVGVTAYQILRDGAVLGVVPASPLTYADTSVSPASTYTYALRAYDAAGNISTAGNAIQVSTPSAPGGGGGNCAAPASEAFTGCYYGNTTLIGAPSLVRTDAQINFDWGFNQPDRAVARGGYSVRWLGNFTFAQGVYTFTAVTSDGMRLYIDGTLVLDRWMDQPATAYNVQQTLSAGIHLITVEYYRASGWAAAHLTWQGNAPVTQPPSVLAFSATPSTVTPGQSATLAWSVNGANGVTIDNGVGNVTGTTSKTVQPAQTTTYTLTASNTAGSVTARVTVTVGSQPKDIQPPSTPTLISASAKGTTEADLAWTVSVDNVGVAGYQIIRDGGGLGAVAFPNQSFADTAVTPGATYAYAIRAYDAAGNYSAPSNTIQVAIPAAPASGGSCGTPAVGAFTGCYYGNTWLDGAAVFVRTDPEINFDWGGNPPDRSVNRRNFSVRWQGSFNFSQGSHAFTVVASDGVRLYIDGNLVLDKWVDESATQYSVQQTLAQGQHLITLEYYESTGWSSAHLTWQ
uniref:Allergen V5/Tpx-1 family protein n=1 Tax=Solibacter usitatus (strain Ellin6076) TaxID=234267 RepID=Q01TD4_SOLUE